MIYDSILETTPHISTVGMNEETWLEKRREGIGGSEAGAVMGMNRFEAPLTVYLAKKGLADKQINGFAVKRGRDLEAVIRNWTIEEYPRLTIESVPFMFHSSEYLFMSANIDGVILVNEPVEIRGEKVDGLGGHEIKTAVNDYGWGEDEIPTSYYCQLQHYIAVTGLPWFMITVYILAGGEGLRHYIVRRNDEFCQKLIEAEKDFWENYFIPGVMPVPIGIDREDDMITSMFAGTQGTIFLGGEERELCAKHVRLNAQKKEIETAMKVIASKVKQAIIGNAGDKLTEKKASAVAGEYKVSWSFFEQRRVDGDALKKAGLYERFCKVSEVDRFMITDGAKKKEAV